MNNTSNDLEANAMPMFREHLSQQWQSPRGCIYLIVYRRLVNYRKQVIPAVRTVFRGVCSLVASTRSNYYKYLVRALFCNCLTFSMRCWGDNCEMANSMVPTLDGFMELAVEGTRPLHPWAGIQQVHQHFSNGGHQLKPPPKYSVR